MVEDFINDESPIMAAIKDDAEKNMEAQEKENEEKETPDVVLEKDKEEEIIEEKVEEKEVLTDDEKEDAEVIEEKEVVDSSEELATLRASIAEKDKLLEEKETLLNTKTDGLKLFADDNMYKINQILINNPNLNKSAVLRLASADLDKMQDTEVLKLQKLTKLQSGDFSEADIEYAINKQYNLTANPSELEGDELKEYNANKFLRNEAAQSARAELKGLMNVEMPERVDLLAMQNESKEKADKALNDNLESWKPKTDEIIKSLDKFKIEFEKGEEFEFVYDDEFKSYLKKNLNEYAARTGLDVSKPESLKVITESIENDYVNKKLPQMLKTFKSDLLAKQKEANYNEEHNIKDPDLKEAPDKLTDEQKRNKKADDKLADRLQKGYF